MSTQNEQHYLNLTPAGGDFAGIGRDFGSYEEAREWTNELLGKLRAAGIGYSFTISRRTESGWRTVARGSKRLPLGEAPTFRRLTQNGELIFSEEN